MKRFRKALLICLGALTLGVTACNDSKEQVVEKKDETTKLTFYFPVNVGGKAANLVSEMTEEFNKQNTDIVVEPVYTGNYDDTVTKIQTAAQGGNPPELFVSLATQRFTLSNAGMAMPLDDLIKKDGEEGKKYIEDFLPGFMEDSYVEGKIYSIPFQRSTMVLFYNKDAFTEVGLDPEKAPTTWAELADYSVKLTNDHRKGVGIALNSGSAQWGFTGFALQNSTDGKNLMNEDGKKVYFNTPENVEALQFWLDLQNKYKSMASGIVQWTDLPTQFLAGEVAMIYHTTGNFANIRDNAKFNYGVAFLPGNKRVAAPTGGGNFYITPNLSPEKEAAAWKFIKFMTIPDNVAKWSIETGYVPTRESAYQTEQLKEYYTKYPEALVAYEQLPYAKPELTTYNAAQIWRILNDNIQSAVTGEATPQEALDNAQREATEVLNEYN